MTTMDEDIRATIEADMARVVNEMDLPQTLAYLATYTYSEPIATHIRTGRVLREAVRAYGDSVLERLRSEVAR